MMNLPLREVLLKNKWVFILKRDKESCIFKYKARLVIKGFGQCLEHNYLETHSSVVRMESICAILAIATAKDLITQQMDVKDTYLNGTLKEIIYICQPDGYGDGTERVCCLIKILYGLSLVIAQLSHC